MFAIYVAKRTRSRVSILHAYHLPQLPVRNTFYTDEVQGEKNLHQAETQLHALVEDITDLRDLDYEILARPVYGPAEIPETILSYRADLIMMGTRGSDKLRRFILGSTTAGILNQATCPVITVPEQITLLPLHKIGFAYDGKPITNLEKMSFLRWLANFFNAELEVFHIKENEAKPDFNFLDNNLQLLLSHLNLSGDAYSEIMDPEIEHGIYTQLVSRSYDMLAMMPKRQTFFQELLTSSLTKSLVFQAQVPILAIPD